MSEGDGEARPGKLDPLERWYFRFEIIAKFGLVFAGLFAVYQFWAFQEAQKIERAVTYVDRFETGAIADARRVLRAKTRPYYRQFSEISRSGISAEDRADITMLLVEEDDDGSYADAIETVVDFFEGLKLCMDEGLCERSVARGYFCPNRAGTYWENYAPYIEDRRQNNPTFGVALEWCAGERPR